jgi:hypothetical protein
VAAQLVASRAVLSSTEKEFVVHEIDYPKFPESLRCYRDLGTQLFMGISDRNNKVKMEQMFMRSVEARVFLREEGANFQDVYVEKYS